METIVYLTRHGQTQWNIEKRIQGKGNSPLTPEGIKGAEDLRNRVAEMEIDIIYASPIERALQTAQIVKGEKDVPLHTHDGLMEMGFGDYEGKSVEELAQVDPQFDMNAIKRGDLTMCAPNGETIAILRQRVKEAMDNILQEHQGKRILVVTHGITLKAIMHYFDDEEVDEVVMGQATLTKIVVDSTGKFTIAYKNDHSHFTTQPKEIGW